MLLKSICTPDVIHCGPAVTALEAARLMREKHAGDLVVVDDPQGDQVPLGIVTDRDIVVQVLGKGLDPATTTVGSIVRTPVVVVDESEDIFQAIERMRAHGVRRIPVVSRRASSGSDSGRRLVGIISLDDLLKQLAAVTSALADIVSKEQSRENHTRR